MRVAFVLMFFLIFQSAAVAHAQDGESILVLSCKGKGYKNGDTIHVHPGEKLKIRAKVFIKEFNVKGGTWMKNNKGEWRFYNEIKGYRFGLGVGNMSLNILKEEYEWTLEAKKPVELGKAQELNWNVPLKKGEKYTMIVSTKTEGQVKTEGSASVHGVHLDYNMPGGGKKIFKGKASVTIIAEEPDPSAKKSPSPQPSVKKSPFPGAESAPESTAPSPHK